MSQKTIFVTQSYTNPSASETTLPHHPQGYFECPALAKSLKENYKILAQPIGSFCHLTQQKQMKGPPFQLDTYSLAYLIKNHIKELSFECLETFPLSEIINEDSYIVFESLKNKGYYLISAQKFGAKFLAYSDDPTTHHAKYLVFLQQEQNQPDTESSGKDTENLIFVNRLSTIAKKEAILAKLIPISREEIERAELVHSNQNAAKSVQYTKMQRLQHY